MYHPAWHGLTEHICIPFIFVSLAHWLVLKILSILGPSLVAQYTFLICIPTPQVAVHWNGRSIETKKAMSTLSTLYKKFLKVLKSRLRLIDKLTVGGENVPSGRDKPFAT